MKQLCVVTIFLLTVWSQAGVLFTVEVTDKEKNTTETRTMQVEGNKIAMIKGSTDPKPEMVYRGDLRAVWFFQHENQRYMAMDQDALKQFSEKMGGVMSQAETAMKQAQAQINNLPPEQRAMVEKMMKQKMGEIGGMAEQAYVPPTVKQTGQSKNVAGYSCKLYEVYQGDEKRQELWITPWRNVKGGHDAQQAMKDMSGFFEEMMEGLRKSSFLNRMDNPYTYLNKIDGFPVMTRSFREGVLTEEVVLKSSERKSIPAEVFEAPPGYKRYSPMDGM